MFDKSANIFYIRIMLKKPAVYISLFLFLLIINFISIYKLTQNQKRTMYIQKVLSEIENDSFQNQFNSSGVPLVLGTFQAEAQITDGRVANLKNFFRKYNSPLYDEAELIVSVSDQYKFDYRLLPAIAMQESNLCKYIPENSYNCWGWGIYGSTVTRFDSYSETIKTVAKGIKNNYINQGLITASSIMEKYTPSSNGSWAHGVNTFLRMLE